MEKILKNKENILYFFITIVFIALSTFIALRHEPWADEAQAWLIARDTSLTSLFSYYLHFDGHPGLWHVILKIFQLFGLPYSKMYIIPIIFSTLGIIIFEYKSKYPLIIKILFPFTYFIFYQYTIVARGYCLLFPLLCLIACIWNDKFKKPYIFTALLILLSNTEAYTYLFSGMLFLLFIYELLKNKYDVKKYLPYIIILIITFILTPLYVYPLSSTTFHPSSSFYFISDSFITPYHTDINIKIILTVILILYLLIIYYKNKKIKDLIILSLLLLPVILFYIFFYYNIWHLGILFLLFIFILWIQNNMKNKYITLFLIITCIIQCYYTYKSVAYDYLYNYSGAKDTANFISEYDYNNLKIYGVGFNAVAINAYFDNNIYSNWNKDLGFFFWSIRNEYYNSPIEAIPPIEDDVDIIIVSDFSVKYDNNLLEDKYNIYNFEGNSYAENFIYENNSYTVYISKSIDEP